MAPRRGCGATWAAPPGVKARPEPPEKPRGSTERCCHRGQAPLDASCGAGVAVALPPQQRAR